MSGKVKNRVKDEGKFIQLPGAEIGKVVVRFPPEASGYLHIGHAKAALLNEYYQQNFQGKLIMRFDDTNPAKEDKHFENVILDDLKMLQIQPDAFSHTSDYFDQLLEYCTKLLQQSRAYVDDTDAETMKRERDQRKESRCRHQSVETNMQLWEEMKKGMEDGQRCAVRLKIDMNSNNGCMRDPTIFRCKVEPHVRTGDKYKVYPTYDFACPVVDSIEGVTHALRTTEYHDRDEQYYYILDSLGLRKPYIWEYSRLNMMNTVMSKRKLTWIVDEGIVNGWDDPRFPTVRGVLRRGMTVEGLKQFIVAQGSSRAVVMMEWDKIWAFNKKVIDPLAPRYTALIKENLVTVNVKQKQVIEKAVPKHPKNSEIGQKRVLYGPSLFVEQDDACAMELGQIVTFINWGNMKIVGINKTPEGCVSSIDVDFDLDNKDYKKTLKVTWICNSESESGVPVCCSHFDHIVKKAVLGKDEDWKNFINFESERRYEMLGEQALKELKKGDIIQLQRKGFYICEQPYRGASGFSGSEIPLILYDIPDGQRKEQQPPISQISSSASLSHLQQSVTESDSIPGSSLKTDRDFSDPEDILLIIKETGDRIRKLKASKTDQSEVDEEVHLLQAYKAKYKELSGVEWNPRLVEKVLEERISGASPVTPSVATMSSDRTEIESILLVIKEIGDKIRKLKSEKADKALVDCEVKKLLAGKEKYKQLTGEPWNPNLVDKVIKKSEEINCNNSNWANDNQVGEFPGGKKEKKKGASDTKGLTVEKRQTPKPCTSVDDAKKKQTKLGLETLKEENFSEWYSQVLTKAEMIEYYDVSGCYVLRPWAYSVWEMIQGWFDAKIKELGVDNVYFPMFVSGAALEREKTHIADFAPEVAWVTKSGQSDMAEPVAIRPTSETVMYPSFAKWIQSHRDLPIKVNQWCNVVRWEFKHPTPFLRTREFLWQEGHTAHTNAEDAQSEVYTILDLYASVYTDLLAVPVIKGRKTEKEKFAGGEFTTTVEVYIPANGRGVQAATSHHLGQNFSKMFEIVFENPETLKKQYAYQNSWGLSTRSLGVFTMIHGDNAGLVLPPRIAKIQIVIIPCGITAQLSKADEQNLYDKCQIYAEMLKDANFHVKADMRDNYSPGWKFNHWELKGVPVRMELGPRDVAKNQVILVRRDTFQKQTVGHEQLLASVCQLLDDIQSCLYKKAKKAMEDHVIVTDCWKEFCQKLEEKCIIQSPFCGDDDCEAKIKKDSAREECNEPGAPAMGAKSLCIPFEQPKTLATGQICVHPTCGRTAKFYCLFGRSY